MKRVIYVIYVITYKDNTKTDESRLPSSELELL